MQLLLFKWDFSDICTEYINVSCPLCLLIFKLVHHLVVKYSLRGRWEVIMNCQRFLRFWGIALFIGHFCIRQHFHKQPHIHTHTQTLIYVLMFLYKIAVATTRNSIFCTIKQFGVLLCALVYTIQTLSRRMRQSFSAIPLFCSISLVIADVELTFK